MVDGFVDAEMGVCDGQSERNMGRLNNAQQGLFSSMLQTLRAVKVCPRAGDFVGSTQEPSRPCVLRTRNSSHARRLFPAAEQMDPF